jgi:N-sulfoglucosamine sulfohydrolase
MMNRPPFALLTLILLLTAQPGLSAGTPNVLIIMADDCTYNDLPLYGGQNAQTPNLEKLAATGLTFNRAYLAEAMCQPCRAELYSGLYPMRNGCAWNHSASLPETLSMPHHFGGLGYRVGIAGKVHVLPESAFPFESVDGFDGSCVRNPTKSHDLTAVTEFMVRDKQQPFCLVVALVEPHVPWVMGDASAYPVDQIKLPPNIADTPLTRESFARYLAEITYMDGQVGELLDVLDGSGLADDTLVLFTSEQGSQFPGNKWTNWDTGLHTALIARMPGVVPVGRRTDALVQYADVLPTLLEMAGAEFEPSQFDGTSFAEVLRGTKQAHRKYVYGVHNNVPEGPPFPIRSISDGTYRYVRNLKPANLYIERHLMGTKGDGSLNNPYWQTWVWDAADTPKTYALVSRYLVRPAEALYHTAADPYELQNLVGSESRSEIMQMLSAELDRWLESQADPGIEQDTSAAHQAAKKGQHRFRPPLP